MILNQRIVATVFLAVALVYLAGCSNQPAPVSAPTWEPEAVADRAMTTLDTSSDGQLSATELDAAPGLKYCADQLDTNGDGQLSREEIVARFTLYRDMDVGLRQFNCRVVLDDGPLGDAMVKLVPESFIGDVIEPATGKSSGSGKVRLDIGGQPVPTVRIGMYRVEVTSPSTPIPARYNTQTTLGIEIAPITNRKQSGGVVFRLTSG